MTNNKFNYSKKLSNQQGNIKQFRNYSNNIKYNIRNPNFLFFLGGFVEGEGSNSISVSIGRNFKFGVNLQPVFNVSQHVNGLNILNSFKEKRCARSRFSITEIRIPRYLSI